MKCSIIPTLSTSFVRYYPWIDLEPLRDYLKTAEFNHGALKQTKNHHLHEVPELRDIFLGIQECLDHYKEYFQYDCDRIKPTLSWANISSEKEMHPEHNHPNSLVSGILYLNNAAPTLFSSPMRKMMGVYVSNKHDMIYESAAIPGHLVLFPSYVEHFTSPGSERVTLSFNTMPVGIVNKGTLMEHTY